MEGCGFVGTWSLDVFTYTHKKREKEARLTCDWTRSSSLGLFKGCVCVCVM
jgi:hypothetical protein